MKEELKTLKDFAWKKENPKYKDRILENELLRKELKKEAINWVKLIEKEKEQALTVVQGMDTHYEKVGAINVLKDFFNITDRDLNVKMGCLAMYLLQEEVKQEHKDLRTLKIDPGYQKNYV